MSKFSAAGTLDVLYGSVLEKTEELVIERKNVVSFPGYQVASDVSASEVMELFKDRVRRQDHWLSEAECRDWDKYNPDDFTPTGDRDPNIEYALTACRVCPVLEECRTYALEHNETQSVWGGLTPKQLQAISKRKQQSTSQLGRLATG